MRTGRTPRAPEWALSKDRATTIALEIETLHPEARALVLYSYGTGGYIVAAESPIPGQDVVALISEGAYRVFRALRGDAWARAAKSKGSWPEERRRREMLALEQLKQEEHAREGR